VEQMTRQRATTSPKKRNLPDHSIPFPLETCFGWTRCCKVSGAGPWCLNLLHVTLNRESKSKSIGFVVSELAQDSDDLCVQEAVMNNGGLSQSPQVLISLPTRRESMNEQIRVTRSHIHVGRKTLDKIHGNPKKSMVIMIVKHECG